MMSLVTMLLLASLAQGVTSEEETNYFFNAMEHLEIPDFPDNYFDPQELAIDESSQHIRPRKVTHLTLDYQFIQNGLRGDQSKACYMGSDKMDDWLAEQGYYEITGKSQSFDTIAAAISISKNLHEIEKIQPNLAWKPLEIICCTLDNMTQGA